MKKILLIIALLISGLGLNAQSVIIDNLEFTITSETPAECEVSGYSGEPVNVTIPSTVTISGKEYSVTSIGERAFFWCSSLTSIELPSGVTSIGNDAFFWCSSLTSIEIPSSVTSIGDWAFYDCSSLTSIEIPSGVTSIGKWAFSECSSLTSIEIPSGVTSIGEGAFSYCANLTSIVVESGNTVYDSRDNCNAIIETATNTLIAGCQNTVIPSSVTSIGEGAFSGCSSLTSIELPSGVTSIGEDAFYDCSSLTSIELPSGVTSIGDYAFVGCSSLTSIIVESGNTVYDSRDNCNAIIETATNTLIAGCQNTVIPSSVTSIGEDAFSGCSSLTSIDFGENSQLTSIGEAAFYGCSSLTSIELPSGVTSIGAWAFYGCSSLTSIELPSGVTSIGAWAFYGCSSLTSIELPSGVASIGEGAFSGCSSLTSIELPSGVTSIGNYAFEDCSSLTSIEIPSSVTSIGEDAFSGCSSLTSIELPSGVTSIGDYAFSYCSSLTSIEIPSSVTSIGDWAFYDCSSLTSIEIPSSVTSIGDWAFYDCSSLTSIYCYAESVPETYSNAFYYCPSDMVIYVPEQSVGAYKAASPWKGYTILPLETETVVCDVPQNLKVVVTKDDPNYNKKYKITLTWDAVEGAEGYKVYAVVRHSSGGTFIGYVDVNEYIDGVNTEGELYFYVTTICNGDLGIESEPSERVLCVLAETEFDVVAATNIENAGIISGAGTYSQGDTVTLTATANEGYKFINWTENGEVVSEEAEYTFVITEDRNLVANFELLSYNVTASVNPENAGVVNGAGTYNHGEEVTLTAKANEGYKFINWTENGEVVSEEAEYSFVITSDRNLVANFELLSYNVTASLNPENAGVVNGAGTYNHGEEVTLTATANEGYKFINWTENGEVVSEEAEYSFEITENRNLVANFELLSYNVTASVNPENVGVVTGAGTYNHGEDVTLTATANEGYKFINWTENGEVVSEEAEYSFEITKDRNLVANFELLSYNVTASLNPENAGVVNGSGTYNHGEDVTLTATANEGYKFINWTENGEVVSEEAEYSFVITSDRNLVANFELLSYNVTASVNPEEGGSVSGAGTYKKDMTVTLKAIAKSGYQFLNWTENDVIVSTESEYTFTITKDINLVANFEKTTCNVTAVVNPEEAGTVIGAGTYVKNMSVTLVATANPGYKFVNWTENGTIVSTEREYSFVVSLDTDLVANFVSTEGVEELTSSFNIYPNPVNDKLYIETLTQTQTVEIYDVYGRRQSMVNGQQSTVIDVSDLNSGIYFVKVVTSEGEVVKRFIKD